MSKSRASFANEYAQAGTCVIIGPTMCFCYFDLLERCNTKLVSGTAKFSYALLNREAGTQRNCSKKGGKIV